MKPQVVGPACSRVQQALDEALSEGVLNLPPELAAHAARCPRCEPEWRATENLLSRLRGAVAGLDLGRVPQVVDYVMANTATSVLKREETGRRQPFNHHWRWVVGQVAAVAAVLLVTVSGFTYAVLKLNQAVSGVQPSQVLSRMVTPLQGITQAKVRDAR